MHRSLAISSSLLRGLSAQNAVRTLATTTPAQKIKVDIKKREKSLTSPKISHFKVQNPVVDLDGDEMTRIIWDEIKKKVVFVVTANRQLILEARVLILSSLKRIKTFDSRCDFVNFSQAAPEQSSNYST